MAVALGLPAAGARRWMAERVPRRVVVASAPIAGGVLHALYVTRVGGDFMHARMLLPSLFAMLMPVAVVEASNWRRAVAAAVLAPWAVLCATGVRRR